MCDSVNDEASVSLVFSTLYKNGFCYAPFAKFLFFFFHGSVMTYEYDNDEKQ